MKSSYFLAPAILLASPVLALAQPVRGPYVSLGVGANLLQNEILEPDSIAAPGKRSYTFDPGAAGFGSFGWGFGNGLRAELEGDYAIDHVHGVRTAGAERAGGSEQHYGGFVNALYDISLALPVTPYVGIGVGYQQVELDRVNSSSYSSTLGPQKSGEAEGAFAYQAIAGLSYPLQFLPGLALTAEYRFIGVTAPSSYVRSNGAGNTVVVNGVTQSARSTLDNIFDHEILVGLRYAFGTPSAPPQSAPADSTAPAPEQARTYLVFFDWDRATLTDRARQIIADAASASPHVATTRIEVDGYTDLSGTARYNQGLSLRRADAVAGELVRLGVPKTAIDIRGFGETRPLVPTASGVREPQNRRVEIILK